MFAPILLAFAAVARAELSASDLSAIQERFTSECFSQPHRAPLR